MAQLRRATCALLAGALALVGACTDEHAAVVSGSPCAGGGGGAKALVRCAPRSVGYVTNPMGTGTGLVIEVEGARHILTNLHVVDPFSSADVSFGTRTIEDVPVRWVDASTDLAVLGPVQSNLDLDPVPLVRIDGDLRGEPAYLVGFPGEAGGTRPVKPTDLQATIASGIVSRTRHLDEWGLSFVQTDASIAGGQSGGPLFDEHGRVLGISGLSFADAFGLALGVEDVIESIERMVDTGGDDYLSLPIDEDGSGERGGFAGLSDGTDVQRLYLGRSDEERQLDFAIADPEDAVVRILSIVHEATLATSSNAEDLYGSQLPLDGTSALEGWRSGPSARRSGPWQQDDEQALPPDDPLPPADDVEVEVEPGRFELQIDRGDIVLIELERPLAEGPTGVLWSSNLPLHAASTPREAVEVSLGEVVDRVVTPYTTSFDVLVELEAGMQVEMHARSAIGDSAFVVFPPGVVPTTRLMSDPEADIQTVDDSDSGLYGTDAKQRFEIERDGRYRIRVESYDRLTELVRFSVVDCAEDVCEDGSEVGRI